MKFEIVTQGYDPSAVTLVKLKNGAVIARSTTPVRDTMKPYVDPIEVSADELLRIDNEMKRQRDEETRNRPWWADLIK